LILVAGSAISLSGGAHLLVLMAESIGRFLLAATEHRADLLEDGWVFWSYTRDHLRNALRYGFQVSEMLLAGLTPAFFAVRLKRPRPPLSVVVRNAGTVAALAMVLGLFWGTGLLFLLFPERFAAETCAGIAVGGSVAVAWAGLALSRRWRTEPTWIDRFGRLLGAAAIVTGLVALVVFRF
jgi:hypothetical protein